MKITQTKIYKGQDSVLNALQGVLPAHNIRERHFLEGCDYKLMLGFDATDYFHRVFNEIADVDIVKISGKDLEVAELGVLAKELGDKVEYLVGKDSYIYFWYNQSNNRNYIEVYLYRK